MSAKSKCVSKQNEHNRLQQMHKAHEKKDQDLHLNTNPTQCTMTNDIIFHLQPIISR